MGYLGGIYRKLILRFVLISIVIFIILLIN
jgi:hypothetical protein